MKELKDILLRLDCEYRKKKIKPESSCIFRSFHECPYENVRIIMLGQDPYPQEMNGENIATGVMFANKIGTDDNHLSPSLRIIQDSLKEYEKFNANCCEEPYKSIKFDPTMKLWENQGILMLNTALTVEMNNPGSHALLWRTFMINLLKNLSISNPGIIYVLFGKQAQSFFPYIDKRETVISELHPAYYARIDKEMPFKVFFDIDKAMQNKYNEKIKWYEFIND